MISPSRLNAQWPRRAEQRREERRREERGEERGEEERRSDIASSWRKHAQRVSSCSFP
ncbi:hypothetical protein EYF80_066595 [Liparis tanakae]|uniref:Uncharacterized protein n=1 Tax=Liparis tanakae TaxID=230148 RepID=A0A4Z2E304_9TELE|nr:hypothetical protein EYF80_066595 [Liparis tanakae]